MTSAADPTGFKPVVALFCTRGMETFLSNAIQGILRTGIDADQIVVGCPDNALRSVNSVTRAHSFRIQVISTHELSENVGVDEYSSFGSRSFTEISWRKIHFIRQLIELHSHVIYADLDISWIRNPLPYLSQVASVYPIAIQTEGLPRFPPALCFGFASFVSSERAIALLDALLAFHSTQINSDDRLDDQAALQRLVENDVTWLRDVFCLPEALFLNGLGYRTLQNDGVSPCPMEGELLPFLFHANWTVGIDNKRKLLASTGTWLLGDITPIDQTTVTSGSPTSIASDSQAHTEPPPLLAVIYPVFDVRGDVVEHVRLWTQKQDLQPDRYRVFVVADAQTNLDEARLRQVLRNHDVILRVPGVGREADFWNAGARAARTPWILFVEGHALPEQDSLSALAAWIEANPHGEACNFTIQNFERNHVARLMKRWFGEIQSSWAAPSTWRRLHRTAFAIRRDVFAEQGPFEPEYGQFAPPLISARLHQRNISVALIPTSRVIHEDSPDIASHHADTADHVRGEMDARANSDPVFFEKYFGPPPTHGPEMILPAQYARSMIKGLAVAVLRRPGEAFSMLKQAAALLPVAFSSLQARTELLAALTRVDEFSLMRLPITEETRWRRFIAAHRRVVRTEQMLWIARNPLSPLPVGPKDQRWPIVTVGQHAIVGLHALEHLGAAAFRWTHPIFLLRVALKAKGVLTLETRNVGRQIGLSDIVIVVGRRTLLPGEIMLDDAGNIKFNIEPASARAGETDVVVIVRELREPSCENERGRHLGLPLFSVDFISTLDERPVN